ncbi:MAG: class B sortase [Solobacterium sp.]|nr:class B sortase [Solobacterium sp.]
MFENKKDINDDKVRFSFAANIIREIDHWIDLLILTFVLLIGAVTVYALYDSQLIYSNAESTIYSSFRPDENGEKSFDELCNLNHDVFGWLDIYGTNINYPIVQASNNERYVSNDVLGNYSLSGAIFLDYRDNKSFLDFNSIVYGHHMAHGAMFGDIDKFEDETFFNNHPYGSIFFDDMNHGIEIVAFIKCDAYDMRMFNPDVGINYQDQFLNDINIMAIHKRDISISTNDHIIAFSTCASPSETDRQMLIAKLTDEVRENPYAESNDDVDVVRVLQQRAQGEYKKVPVMLWILDIISILFLLFLFIRAIVSYHKNSNI